MNLSKSIEKLFVIEGQSVDEARKRTFLFFCIVICIPFVAIFAINDLKNQRIWEGLAILFGLSIYFQPLCTKIRQKFENNVSFQWINGSASIML